MSNTVAAAATMIREVRRRKILNKSMLREGSVMGLLISVQYHLYNVTFVTMDKKILCHQKNFTRSATTHHSSNF